MIFGFIRRKLHLDSINERSITIMATLEQVKLQISGLAQSVADEAAQVQASVEALKAQIAAGTAATPEDLDGIIANLQAVQAAVSAIIVPEPAAEPNSGGGPGEEEPGPKP